MKEFTAYIVQTPQTIRRYSEVQYNVFHTTAKVTGAVIAVALVLVGGFVVKQEAVSLLLVFLGCVLFTNLNAPANFTANRVISLFRGKFPTIRYRFTSKGMQVNDKAEPVPYSKFIRLVEDENYFYLFQSPQYGSMIRKDTVAGAGSTYNLRDMLQEQTGLKWTRPPTALNFKLKNIQELFGPGDDYTGPRLGR